MSKKVCLVPSCSNSSKNTPTKLFLAVPVNVERRKKWFLAVKTKQIFHLAHNIFCCEDHFNLQDDSSNWMYYKIMGTSIKLKPYVVPHKFIDSPPEMPPQSALTDSAKKRKLEFQEKLSLQNKDWKIETTEAGPSSEKDTIARQLFPEKWVTISPSKSAIGKTKSPSQSGNFQVLNVEEGSARKKCVAVQVSVKKRKFRSVQTNTKSVRFVNIATSPVAKLKQNTKRVQVKPKSSPASSCSSKSGVSESVESEYASTSSYESKEEKCISKSYLNEIRRKTTVQLIEQNSRMYLGIPENVYPIVKFICEQQSIDYNDILLTLKKIRLGDTYSRLALDFGISTSSVQRKFVKSVPKVTNVLQNLIFWPKPEEIKKLLPLQFKARYNHIQSIIDCFEVEIEKPVDPVAQASTWSEYKNCNTVKFLISCTPNGFINFISEGYGGRISDKEIVEQGKYLHELPKGAGVLADRGFKHVGAILQEKGCTLIRPPTVSVDKKSSKDEVKQSKVIASLRIHIERVIRRVREFSMLEPHACVNHHLVSLLNYIVIIACALVNCQEPLTKQ